ncbi:MAG: XRE family transcriptional regulator [Verrucomicrobia bacterium]|nr:MAG: XRE family transcriptional regulator [Verrucomicrobiota bacterium]
MQDKKSEISNNAASQRPRRRRRAPSTASDPAHLQFSRRLRVLRRQRGWSLEDLAAASAVSRSMLSEIERGNANPTLAVACRIAAAFGLSVGQLVDGGAASPIEVVRAGDPAHLYRSDEQCRIRTLSPLHLEKQVEFYEVTLRPEGALRSAPHYAGTREFLTVVRGKVGVESGEHRAELAAGDSAHYRADLPHAIVNLAAEEAVVFLVVSYPGGTA